MIEKSAIPVSCRSFNRTSMELKHRTREDLYRNR